MCDKEEHFHSCDLPKNSDSLINVMHAGNGIRLHTVYSMHILLTRNALICTDNDLGYQLVISVEVIKATSVKVDC